MTHATDAARKMNEFGKHAIPFIFVIDFEMLEPVVVPEQEALAAGIRYSFRGFSNDRPGGKQARPFTFSGSPVAFDRYLAAFDQVMHHILNGDSYLVNLTFPTPVSTSLTLEEIYRFSKAPYSLLMDDRFVVFSPEPFVRISEGRISSFPMKGTIDASIPDAEKQVLEDPKEQAEHNTIVDLIRNDLSLVANHVQVKRFRYIDRVYTHLRELLQVSSEITGVLDPGYPAVIGDLIFSMLPAGSVSGAPKKRTVEIIRVAEMDRRGFYTGVMGRFDGRTLDSGVMIRFIEKTPSGVLFRSGGGITFMSQAESEYREMIDKVYVPFS